MKKLAQASLALAAWSAIGFAHAAPYYSTDFDSGIPTEFSGAGFSASVQGYAGTGNPGNQFSGNYLRDSSTAAGAAGKIIFTLNGLPAHTSVSLGFLLGIIDSWDGKPPGGCCNPDILKVNVNGNSVFSETFTNFSANSQSYPRGANMIVGPNSNLAVSNWNDSAYDMGLEAAFQNIAHTSSTLTVEWFASGAGWQGGDDESFAIDNLRVTLNGTADPGLLPEPSLLGLLGLGLAGLALGSRRRK